MLVRGGSSDLRRRDKENRNSFLQLEIDSQSPSWLVRIVRVKIHQHSLIQNVVQRNPGALLWTIPVHSSRNWRPLQDTLDGICQQ